MRKSFNRVLYKGNDVGKKCKKIRKYCNPAQKEYD